MYVRLCPCRYKKAFLVHPVHSEMANRLVPRVEQLGGTLSEMTDCLEQQVWRDTGNLLLGMAAVVDPLHISLEWLTPLQQQTIKQQLLKEMFAVAGVPSDNDALEKDGSNVNKAKTI